MFMPTIVKTIPKCVLHILTDFPAQEMLLERSCRLFHEASYNGVCIYELCYNKGKTKTVKLLLAAKDQFV